MASVTINRATKTILVDVEDKAKVKELLHGRMRWETGRNRWFATGDLNEIAEILKDDGYEVDFIGRSKV